MKEKCFQVIKIGDKKIVNISNPVSSIALEDLEQNDSIFLIHIVFILLLIS
ncbi:MAG: hypothetical protein HY307_04375 [Arcobacter sp.]|nr:hypothetical protein [Arcobacter sp.]